MRILSGLAVGVIGCGITYFGATMLAAISEEIAGPIVSSLLGIILAAGGIAVTIALVFDVVKTPHKSPLS